MIPGTVYRKWLGHCVGSITRWQLNYAYACNRAGKWFWLVRCRTSAYLRYMATVSIWPTQSCTMQMWRSCSDLLFPPHISNQKRIGCECGDIYLAGISPHEGILTWLSPHKSRTWSPQWSAIGMCGDRREATRLSKPFPNFILNGKAWKSAHNPIIT